jgi:hypothetical protein
VRAAKKRKQTMKSVKKLTKMNRAELFCKHQGLVIVVKGCWIIFSLDFRFVTHYIKGSRDFHPYQMKVRDRVFANIIDCFQLHGAVAIDTPIFERKVSLDKF